MLTKYHILMIGSFNCDWAPNISRNTIRVCKIHNGWRAASNLSLCVCVKADLCLTSVCGFTICYFISFVLPIMGLAYFLR